MEINLQQRPLKARLLQFRKKNKRKLQLGKDEQAQDNSTSIQNFREQRQQENIESERTSDSSNSQVHRLTRALFSYLFLESVWKQR